MLLEKEKTRENQAFSSSIISHRIRIMREAAVRMDSKHEETSQSNANMCKALQKQHGILFSKRLQTLSETGGS